MKLIEIYFEFFKIGAILLGGGYVIFPILKSELVEKKNWITLDELTEYFALSQSLPGIIAVNTALFVGNKCRKFIGSIFALAGVITAPVIAIILIANILNLLVNSKSVQGILWGVSIGIVVLLINSVRDIWKTSIIDKFTFLIFIAVVVLDLKFSKISPAHIVIAALIIGIIRGYFVSRSLKREAKEEAENDLS